MTATKSLIDHLKQQFKVNWHGVHGAGHWARVLHFGKAISLKRNADPLVVELFSFLHDSCRLDEFRDLQHGERGAEFARSLNNRFFHLDTVQLDNLCFAIRDHSGGEISTNVTIQTCWDADRLDVGRFGIAPSSQYLSTEASTMIDYAYEFSSRERNTRIIAALNDI